MRRTKYLLLGLGMWSGVWLGLSACVPLYLPPVPSRDRRVQKVELNIGSSAGLQLRGDRLELSLSFISVPEEGWLAVQWFSPLNRQVASDALWISREDVGSSRTVLLPQDVTLEPGRWRAVTSFENTLLRQFDVDTSPPEPEAPPERLGGP